MMWWLLWKIEFFRVFVKKSFINFRLDICDILQTSTFKIKKIHAKMPAKFLVKK